jgi:hypothetical protein
VISFGAWHALSFGTFKNSGVANARVGQYSGSQPRETIADPFGGILHSVRRSYAEVANRRPYVDITFVWGVERMWGRRTGLGGGVTESRGSPKARVCGSVTVEERPVTEEIGQRL